MISITKPYLGEEEAAAAREVIQSGWVTQGPKVKEFEEKFAEFTGSKYACAVSSCTTALHLSLLAIGVKPGDVVITVSHSFIATANAIRHCGAEPVFIDIESSSYNMDPVLLNQFLEEKCISDGQDLFYTDIDKLTSKHSPLQYYRGKIGKVSAILVVHQMGTPCDLHTICASAKKYNLPVIEDAACAIGSAITFDNRKNWEKIGFPHGKLACFSFHPRKILTTGDGGMITTNDKNLLQQIQLLRQHGMSVSDTVRHASNKVIFEEYQIVGYNYRMTDIQAAIGIVQLQKIHEIVTKRRDLVDQYCELLQKLPDVEAPQEPMFARNNWQSFPVLIHKKLDQKDILQSLADNGIAARRGIMNAHQEQPYINDIWNLPQSERARDQAILLPLFHTLSEYELEKIVHCLKVM